MKGSCYASSNLFLPGNLGVQIIPGSVVVLRDGSVEEASAAPDAFVDTSILTASPALNLLAMLVQAQVIQA